jgi:hypothetical protein
MASLPNNGISNSQKVSSLLREKLGMIHDTEAKLQVFDRSCKERPLHSFNTAIHSAAKSF